MGLKEKEGPVREKERWLGETNEKCKLQTKTGLAEKKREERGEGDVS